MSSNEKIPSKLFLYNRDILKSMVISRRNKKHYNKKVAEYESGHL